MWTSADTAREAYTQRLAQIIRDNARRLADASDVTVNMDGSYCNRGSRGERR